MSKLVIDSSTGSIKIACPIGASDECEFNFNGRCMMNFLPCRGMTRQELDEFEEGDEDERLQHQCL